MRSPFLLSIALFSLVPAVTSAEPATSSLPVTNVTLYTSGVGYFERGGAVDGDVDNSLLFPVGQINDVLKSLVLLDTGGGTINPVTYAAQDPVGKQLQAFSIDLSDNPDRATLLNRLRGASVTVTVNNNGVAKTVVGTVVGVETQTIVLPNNTGTTQQATLNLLTETGMRSLPLSAIDDLQINDPKLNSELHQALSIVAQGRDAGKRGITLHFSGHGRRNVLVGYLTESPLWQTSYRLVLGKTPQLQGWALVQNTGQDDWNKVALTLVSGRPISFIQDLYTPLYVPRPVVQARVDASPTPQTYHGDLQASTDMPAEALAASAPSGGPALPGGARGAAGGGGFAGYAAKSENMPTDGVSMNGAFELRKDNSLKFGVAARQSMATSGAKLGEALFTYNIKVPVTVPRQQSAMIPIVASPIQAQPVDIYNVDVQSAHPLSGARVKNTSGLHLMGGPLTVFDEGGNGVAYVGDALMDDTEPNQTRLISYAVDQAMDTDKKPGDGNEQVVSIVISEGVLIASRKQEQSTVYTFKNNSAKARTVVVEHPYRGDLWKLLEPQSAAERTDSLYRFDVAVPAGASKKLTVREVYPEVERYGLLDTDTDALLSYVRQGETSESVRSALRDVITRRRRISEIRVKIGALRDQEKAISNGQQRIRENMKTLDHTSALYQRYVSELNSQETALVALQNQGETLQTELAHAQDDLNNYVAHLNLQ